MTNEAWMQGWAQLESYFQRFQESREAAQTRASLYREHLDVLSDSQFRDAVRECIDTLQRNQFPSIALLRDMAGVAPEAVRDAPIAKAAPDYAARHQAALPERKFWQGPEQKALVEAVAHDYPFVPGTDILDHVERIAVLAGLMKPVRLAAWSLAEIKAGKREPVTVETTKQRVQPSHPPVPETFEQEQAARALEERIKAEDAAAARARPTRCEHDTPRERICLACANTVALAPAVAPPPPAPPKPKPAPPAMTPEPEEEFF